MKNCPKCFPEARLPLQPCFKRKNVAQKQNPLRFCLRRSGPMATHPRTSPQLCQSVVAAALSAAEALERLGREHGMEFWRIRLHAGWARGRLHDAAAGAAEIRRAQAALADQGATANAWFYNVLLAELEGETLGADSALARIDEALALARHVDNRCDFAFPHRLRGNSNRARSVQSRRRGSLPNRHRDHARAGCSQLGFASGALARQTLPIDCPSDRSPRHPRAGPPRFCAEIRNAGDRRGEGPLAALDNEGVNPGAGLSTGELIVSTNNCRVVFGSTPLRRTRKLELPLRAVKVVSCPQWNVGLARTPVLPRRPM